MEKKDFWYKLCELQEVSKKIGEIKKFDIQRSEDYQLLVKQACLSNELFEEYKRLNEKMEVK